MYIFNVNCRLLRKYSLYLCFITSIKYSQFSNWGLAVIMSTIIDRYLIPQITVLNLTLAAQSNITLTLGWPIQILGDQNFSLGMSIVEI